MNALLRSSGGGGGDGLASGPLEGTVPLLGLVGLVQAYLHGRFVHFISAALGVHFVAELDVALELSVRVIDVVKLEELGVARAKSNVSFGLAELDTSTSRINVFDVE